VGQRDIVPGLALLEWVEDDGSITWNGWTEIDWNSQKPKHDPPQFECSICGATGTLEEMTEEASI